MKPETITRKYKMNKDVTVVIKASRYKNSDVYENSITLTFESSDTKPLDLPTRSSIIHYLADVPMEDSQQQLFDETPEGEEVPK